MPLFNSRTMGIYGAGGISTGTIYQAGALNVLIMFSEKIYILAGTSEARDGLSFFDSHAFYWPK